MADKTTERSLLQAVRDVLEPLGVTWAVFGAVAANVYRAEVRTTQDVDILVSVDRAGMEEITAGACASGWMVRAVHPNGWLLRIFQPDVGAVDLVAVETEYQRVALERSHVEELAGGIKARVLSVEDVIIHKLISNRFQDDADIASILEAGHELDQEYLEHWLREWDVEERFAAIEAKMLERGMRASEVMSPQGKGDTSL